LVSGGNGGAQRSGAGPALSSAQTASSATPVMPVSAAGEEPLEPGVALDRGELRVSAEKAGRQVVRQLEQRLEQIERLVQFAGEDVNPDELMLHVRAGERILTDGQELDTALPLPDRVRFAAQYRQSESE